MERQARLTYSRTCKHQSTNFKHRVNVYLGPESQKTMMTGLHRVSDIFCKICFKNVGWTYVTKHSNPQLCRSMLMSSQKSTKKESSSLKGPISLKSNLIQAIIYRLARSILLKMRIDCTWFMMITKKKKLSYDKKKKIRVLLRVNE